MKKVSRKQMARIDEKVPEEYGITVSRMMENAGYQIAEFLRKEIGPEGVTVYAGKGNNGGDALAAARRLHLWGFKVEVVLASENLSGIRREEMEILEKLDVEISLREPQKSYPVALEGLIGYNLNGDPRPPFDFMIENVNRHETIVSIDIPAGVHPDTGEAVSPSVKPDYTVTLAMPKKGLGKSNSGEIWVADISIPSEAYEEFGLNEEFFHESSLISISEL